MYSSRYREQDRLKAFPDDPKDFNLPVLEEFDFIIVGGGTAGCVVARRLADANFKVLLLEAGGTPPPIQSIPTVSGDFLGEFHQEINYMYRTVPQRKLGFRSIGTEAGKMLGGGSSHNSMIYQRGSPFDYDNWADITGDDSWRYSKLLKYFKKFENYMGNFSMTNNGQHGYGGPITITSPYLPQREVWLQAGEELSFQILDSNGPQRIGFSPNENFINFGRRVSTYSAYIKPVEESYRDKLDIRRYSVVSKILFEKNVARGVLYHRHGIPKVAMASKEIILSTGPYVTPILLIKSGIGPKQELEVAKVKPVVILPQVGNNLQDHVFVTVAPFLVTDLSATWSLQKNLSFSELDELLYEGTGPTIYTGANGLAYIVSDRAKRRNPNWPDLQVTLLFQTRDDHALNCAVTLGLPYSRGTLRFNTSATNMEDNYLPINDPRYFTHPHDLERVLEGIEFCFKVLEGTQAFKNIGTRFTDEPIKECKYTVFRSKDYWACYVQYRATSLWHTSGACRMGKPNDRVGSVVDSKLRVHGVKKLRIIDVSIMPRITNANIATPVIMIAEKIAASLIGEHEYRHSSPSSK
ncbi:unnamed protein product [Allacma fusca]|uniref:Glucose-methanol-choline oxidoreductase N-terminal domain-containing protein n=1 Tax=Allacma fusca TaxID=39272 RepID=A0A8J2LGU4_9HEXA|nr:unnamed protein product [Allacma fusca]